MRLLRLRRLMRTVFVSERCAWLISYAFLRMKRTWALQLRPWPLLSRLCCHRLLGLLGMWNPRRGTGYTSHVVVFLWICIGKCEVFLDSNNWRILLNNCWVVDTCVFCFEVCWMQLILYFKGLRIWWCLSRPGLGEIWAIRVLTMEGSTAGWLRRMWSGSCWAQLASSPRFQHGQLSH